VYYVKTFRLINTISALSATDRFDRRGRLT